MIFKDKGQKAEDKQVGGSHYTELTVTPWEVLKSWLSPAQFKGYLLGTTIHYLSRVNVKDIEGKGGLQDIKKAHHVLSYLIEHLEK
jgi:hypothetical protein|tara:strand:- start:2034 stop:2291 length:258 start_codon:yes stop_codon:yes gene_type:complete